MNSNLTTNRCNVCNSQWFTLTFTILTWCCMSCLIYIYTKVVGYALCQSGSILNGFLLCITHIAVCFVEVFLYLISFIVAKKCQLVINLFKCSIYFFGGIPYFCVSCCSFCNSSCFACNSSCFFCNSCCICFCSFLIFFSLFVTLCFNFLLCLLGNLCCFLFGNNHFSLLQYVWSRFVEILYIKPCYFIAWRELYTLIAWLPTNTFIERFQPWTNFISDEANHLIGVVRELNHTIINEYLRYTKTCGFNLLTLLLGKCVIITEENTNIPLVV